MTMESIREEEEDLINQLPGSLLFKILFTLPTKDVVKTSLLCRRWRDIWQSVPGLDLEFNGWTDYDKYDFFNRFIDLNSDLCLQKIKLRYVGYELNAYNETTIDTVIKQKNIQQLDVGGNTRSDRVVEIPPTIYTSCERLVSLKLYNATLPTPPQSVCLPCLKSMDLQQIRFFSCLAAERLISVCPALETLTLDMMYGFKISSQSLLSFCLTRYQFQYQLNILVMQTPRLKYLKLNSHFIHGIIIRDLSSSVKLDLVGSTNFGESYPNFLSLIPRVRDLTISSDILLANRKFSESVPQFHKLSILSVKDIKYFGYWEYLLLFLEKFPNLKSLVMEFQDRNYGINFFDVPHCVSSPLEYVEVRAKNIADMKKLGSYFMANSTALKKFTLHIDQINEKDYVILNELFALPRQSIACEVVVRSRTFATYKPFSLFSCTDGFS